MAFRFSGSLAWLKKASVVAASGLVLVGAEAGVMAGVERPVGVVQAQILEEQRSKAIQLSDEGGKLRLAGKWQAALEKYEQALAIVRQIKDRKSEGAVLDNIGSIYNSQGQYEQALNYFQQSLAIAQKIGDRQDEGLSLNYIGTIYTSLGQYEKALDYFQQSLAINQKVDDGQGERVSLSGIGSIYLRLGRYDEALKYFQQSLAIAQEMGNRHEESASFNHIGSIYFRLSRYDQALNFHRQSLAIAQEVDDRQGEGISLQGIGDTYIGLGQYDNALHYYQQSLSIAQEVGDRHGERVSLSGIGSIYLRLGRYDEALNYFQQSLVIAQEMGSRHEEGVSFNQIGSTYLKLSQYNNALHYYQQSLSIAQEVGDHHGEGISLNNIGSAYLRLGQHEKALNYFQKSLAMYQKIGDRHGESISINNIGSVYDGLSQYEKALDFYQQSLAIDQEIGNLQGKGVSLGNIGRIYASQGQYDQALDFQQKSLVIKQEVGDRQGEGVVLNNIGTTYDSLGQYDQALDFYQQSLVIRQEVGDLQGEGVVRSNIADTFNSQGKSQLATLFYKQSVSIYEIIRADIQQLPIEQQKSYTKTVEHTYRILADLLLQQDRILEAQQVLDLLKVQELEDYLQNTRSSDNSDLIILKPEQEILDHYQALQNTAIQIGRELTQLRQRKTKQGLTSSEETRLQELLTLEKDINQQFNSFIDSDPIQALLDQLSRKTLKQTLPLEDLNALRDNLRKTNAALIYPLILEDRLELILTTPDSPPIRRTVTNFDAQELKQTIVAYRSALESPNDLEGTKKLAQQLYTWLIAPLEADLAAASPDTLIYAPDGVLRYIPLAALHDGEQWLAQRYATNNIVAKSLTEFDTAPANNPRVLAGAWGNQSHSIKAGDKTFDFGSIPFTLSEVQSLAELLPTESLLEQDFSHDNLIAKDLNSFNIIHLATHGKFVTGNAANSFVALGSGEAIPLPDIKNLSLTDVDLVVLSACETGVGGDFGQGEEILGLGYQFQRAGAKAALASLWQVNDGGTQLLMNAFYAALNQGMTKAAAMQTAQQALISSDYKAVGIERAGLQLIPPKTGKAITDDQLSHPYYWAPFILIGNGL